MSQSRQKTPPRLSVGFDAAEQEKLMKLASEQDRSIAYIVKQAVRFYLQQADKGQLPLDLPNGR